MGNAGKRKREGVSEAGCLQGVSRAREVKTENGYMSFAGVRFRRGENSGWRNKSRIR
jgi:hypothetical protein